MTPSRFICHARWGVTVGLACSFLPLVCAQQPTAAASPAATHRAFLDKYCVSCHNDRLKTGDLSLQKIDVASVPEGAETWEKVIRKLRSSSMPPMGMPRPPQAATDSIATYLETSIDRAALAKPNPGRATLHRLNRTEYANAIRELLSLEVDAAALLPADDESYGFDNIADVLKTSPSLLERYLGASWKISRLAVGDPAIAADTAIYRAKPDLSQDGHIDGLPLGTRGGMLVKHNFPLDGEYAIRVRLWRVTAEMIRGLEEPHRVEVSVDGVRVGLVNIGGDADRELSYENPGLSAEQLDQRLTLRVPVKAGPRTVVATFLTESEAQDDYILQPFLRNNLDVLGYRGLPVVDRLTIEGPFKATGPGDTPARRKIFVCWPAGGTDEVPCAKKIISTLARRAFRRPVSDSDLESLLSFYQRGKNEGGSFEQGIEAALQLILASPEFLFRFESDPANLAQGAVYRLNDTQLASRLAFFLWSSIPDDQLLNVAAQGKLKDPGVLEQQVKRMLGDPRSKALVDNFAGQWLYLRNLKNINLDFETFPDFDDNLRQAMKKETDLFFENIIREDRSVMDLLTADYTFINERLARHYGIPGIYGTDYRRVAIKDDNRRGLLGQASILAVTSLPTRTSPVQRGKWILTNILGIPPTPPPPNVPALKEHADAGKPTSLRERMEEHRANPVCAGCHKIMDPIGFALENFDAMGQWRTTDEGAKIDPSGTLYNGTKVDGPVALRNMLASKPDVFTEVLTEKLMTYALGRGTLYFDMPTVRAVVRDAARNNYRFSWIVMGIVKSPEFQLKMKSTQDGDSRTVTASARP